MRRLLCRGAGVWKTARQAAGDELLAAPYGPVLRLLTVLCMPGVHASVAAAADSAGSRDARLAAGTARSGRAVPSGAWYRRSARRPLELGLRAGDRSWLLRRLRARTGMRE
jgi:hypothetical protein